MRRSPYSITFVFPSRLASLASESTFLPTTQSSSYKLSILEVHFDSSSSVVVTTNLFVDS